MDIQQVKSDFENGVIICRDTVRQLIDFALASASAQGALESVAELIVRDVCETDPADPNLNDTICIDVSDLLTIVKRHTGAGDMQSHDSLRLYALLIAWGVRSANAHPSDAMLINKHIRELKEAYFESRPPADGVEGAP